MQYIIGVDIGTSGTKAIALDDSGKVLVDAYQAYPPIIPFPGAHELDPEILLQAVLTTLEDVLSQMDPGHRLLAVSLSSAMHSLMAVDGRGHPLTRIITWADLRSRQEAARLKGTPEAGQIYRHTGTPIHPMSPLCKILWLKNEQPEIFSVARKFISVKEYVWFRLFGKFQIDYSLASATGLFDIRRYRWYEEALEIAGITADQLSDPAPPTHIEKLFQNPFWEKLKLPTGLPFVIGANDGCLANLGTNAISPMDMALTIGTSGAVRMISSAPVEDPGARIFNFILTENIYVTGGATNNGAAVAKWFAGNFAGPGKGDSEGLMSSIADLHRIPAGCDGLVFLPYLFGERAPVWDADARAVFFGIHNGHGRGEFFRSVLEGIGFALYQISLIVRERTGPAEKIYASGGFIQSPLWLQMISDIFGQELFVTNDADASSIGAGFLGLYALGVIRNLDESKKMVSVQQIYRPGQTEHQQYRKNFSVFQVLYEKLKTEFETISHF
jgi:gluconokinase